MPIDRRPRRPRVLVATLHAGDATLLVEHLTTAGFDTRIHRIDETTMPDLTVWPADAAVIDAGADEPVALRFAETLLYETDGGVPPAVLIISEGADFITRIVGLEIGADDVLSRSATPREVASRLRGLLGRLGRPMGRGRVVHLGKVGVDVDLQRLIARDGKELPLSPSEFALLKSFLDEPDRLFSRDELIERAPASGDDVTDRSIDRRIARLRVKLEGGGAVLIEAVQREGYRLTAHARSLIGK